MNTAKQTIVRLDGYYLAPLLKQGHAKALFQYQQTQLLQKKIYKKYKARVENVRWLGAHLLTLFHPPGMSRSIFLGRSNIQQIAQFCLPRPSNGWNFTCTLWTAYDLDCNGFSKDCTHHVRLYSGKRTVLAQALASGAHNPPGGIEKVNANR